MRLPYPNGKRPTLQMQNPTSITGTASQQPLLGLALLAALAIAPALTAQAPSALPAIPPTSAPAPAAASSAPEPGKPHHAEVSFEDGKLNVQADDSSLRQILSSISRKTGMTITGGIEDQRVFGTYGPADPSTVLATLLDGTGVNMLIKEGPGHAPIELVLTSRTGGSSGPAITPQDANIGEEQPAPPPAALPAQPVVRQPVLPAPGPAGTSAPAAAAQTQPVSPQPAPGPPPSPASASSGAPPTVDSVYQQLLQLQKAKAASAAASPATTTAPPK